jgi:hypothetical protein
MPGMANGASNHPCFPLLFFLFPLFWVCWGFCTPLPLSSLAVEGCALTAVTIGSGGQWLCGTALESPQYKLFPCLLVSPL